MNGSDRRPPRSRTTPPGRPVAAAVAMTLLALAACGTETTKRSASGGSSSSSSGSHGSSGSASSSGTTSSSGASTSSGAASSSGAGSSSGSCVGTSSTARQQSVAIYIMLDRSKSMDEAAGASTKWKAVTSALSTFVGQPLDRTSVGLQYFPIGGTAGSGSGNSCTAADYASPEVEIGAIAQTAPTITASMGSQTLLSGTPTSAALQGAIDHSRAWLQARDGGDYTAVVVFATDGEPTSCDQSLDHIDAIAASGLSGSPSIRTFVIGVGRSLTQLNGIAKAGGTTSAFLVDTTSGASDAFLKALNDIRGSAIRCSYALPAPPSGQILDPTRVNVEYVPGGGGATVAFGQAADTASCGTKANAWYYDSATAPTAIHLCPATCTAVEADKAATVNIVLGCTTRQGEF